MSAPAHRLDVSLAGALEIAAIVRAPGVNISEAAQLIEAYACTKASEAKLDAVVEVGNRICSAIEAPLARREPADAQA